MNGDIAVAKTISIRDAGHDEFWLQDQICKNPSILGLGDLDVLDRERRHPQGGRLDILLKSPDDDAMYEVEVMLGETDETHIIRTIEYWNRERRRFPQRQHSAVLVAEHINRRFFEVIHLFSHSIPLIAIQASIVEIAGAKSLLLSKILDAYDEPDDSANGTVFQECNEGYWRQEAPGTLDTSKALLEAIKPTFPTADLRYVNSYIAILVDGDMYMKLETAGGNKSKLVIWFSQKVPPEVNALLDTAKLPYNTSKIDAKHNLQRLYITADSKLIASNAATMVKLTEMATRSWEKS